MEMCEVNALGIEKFYFLNKSFLFMECLKSAPGALVSKTLNKIDFWMVEEEAP
jgi:hypothetical protein